MVKGEYFGHPVSKDSALFLKPQVITFSSDTQEGDFRDKTDLLEYLNSVCMSDPCNEDKQLNFFDGEVLAHVTYKKKQVGLGKEDSVKYNEYVKIKWQPSNKSPSSLIRKLSEDFNLKESE